MSIYSNFKRSFLAATFVAATAVSMSGASAATVLSNGGTIPLAGNGGTFSGSHDTAGSFTDTFTFVTGDIGIAAASVTSIRVGKFGDVAFSSITLDGNAFTPFATGAVEFWSIDNISLSAGSHTITLVGSSNGSATQRATYSGTLNIAAVPEPATWGMMIVGFGLVGAGMRSRKSVAAFA